MMNHGVMARQMFQRGGPVRMQQGGDPVMQAGINNAAAAFAAANGRPAGSLNELAAWVQSVNGEGVTGPGAMGQPPMPETGGPRPAGQPMPSDMPPPQRLSPEYFQDMQPVQGGDNYPPRGDMEMDPSNMRTGPVIRRQGGGPGMVMPQDMAAMAQEMPAAAAASLQQGATAASSDPEMEAAIMAGSQSFGDPETAENYGEMMNMTRGDEASVEARRAELAQLVGPDDAERTPESVLALLQPVMMVAMSETAAPEGMPVDGGIGPLAASQMTTPVQGDMSGGVMSLANTPPQMQGMA